MINENELNCMTFAAGKNATVSGRVLIGHNEDDNGTISVRHGYVPAADWPDGTVLPAENGCAAIPQVPHTYGYYWTEYKKSSGGISNADSFINECGVCIVSNSMAGSKESDDDNDILCTEGGVFYNLRRCLAERSSSAREGAKVLMELMDMYGYASSGRAYTIADKDEVFHFQLVRGKHYMGARLPDDAIMVMPNHYTFRTLSDCPEMFYPDDIIEYAVKRGFYTPGTPGDYSDFDFSLAYQAPKSRRDSFNTSRQRQGQHMLLGMSPYSTDFSFCHKYTQKVDAGDFASALSSHSESFFTGQIGFGPGLTPHDLPDNSPICRTTTLESSIIEPGDTPCDTVIHAAFGRPCEVPYISFMPLRALPAQLGAMADARRAMDEHLLPDMTVGTVENSPLAKIRACETLADLTYCRTSVFLGSFIRENHQSLNEVKKNTGTLRADNGLYFEAIADKYAETVEMTLRRIRPEVQPMGNTDGAMPASFRVRFSVFGEVDPYSLVAGPRGRSVRRFYSKLASPEKLIKINSATYEAEFAAKPLSDVFTFAGTYPLFVAGKTTDGVPFAGETIFGI